MTRELYFAGAALAVAGILLVVMVAAFGAQFEASTVALAVAAGALMYALRAMFGIVHALARPDLVATLHEQRDSMGSREELVDEQKRVLKAIKELDFDHQVGKLSNEDHDDLSRTYRLRAVELMRSLDGGGGGVHPELARVLGLEPRDAAPSTVSAKAEPATRGEASPEAEADEHGDSPAKPARPGEAVDVPEKMSEQVPAPVPELNTGKLTESTTRALICGPCGTVNEVDARFCKSCGEGLS